MSYVFQPAPAVSVPVVGRAERFPVRRIYCVGRNYVEHAKEMGFTGREPPFFFLKPADAAVVVNPGQTAALPPPLGHARPPRRCGNRVPARRGGARGGGGADTGPGKGRAATLDAKPAARGRGTHREAPR